MNNGIINIQKIINGETAKLSIAQIAFVLVNMSEAKKIFHQMILERFMVYLKVI